MDVFVSAANAQVDALQKENLVGAMTGRVVAMNRLVLVVPATAAYVAIDFKSLADPAFGRVAIGEPKTVPAGQYAQQVIESVRLGDALRGRIVYGTNVRQVLAYVERGEVAAGIVYATDAKQAGNAVRVVATAADNTHEPIVYPGIVVAASTKRDVALKFLNYLGQADAKAVFRSKGFHVVDDATTRPGRE